MTLEEDVSQAHGEHKTAAVARTAISNGWKCRCNARKMHSLPCTQRSSRACGCRLEGGDTADWRKNKAGTPAAAKSAVQEHRCGTNGPMVCCYDVVWEDKQCLGGHLGAPGAPVGVHVFFVCFCHPSPTVGVVVIHSTPLCTFYYNTPVGTCSVACSEQLGWMAAAGHHLTPHVGEFHYNNRNSEGFLRQDAEPVGRTFDEEQPCIMLAQLRAACPRPQVTPGKHHVRQPIVVSKPSLLPQSVQVLFLPAAKIGQLNRRPQPRQVAQSLLAFLGISRWIHALQQGVELLTLVLPPVNGGKLLTASQADNCDVRLTDTPVSVVASVACCWPSSSI
jgi:hypothetical protein